MNHDISQPFRNLGNQINSLPHIKIGVNGEQKKGMSEMGISTKKYLPKPLFNPKEQDVLDKVKKYALIIVVTIIIGYAVYRIFA